MAVVRKMRSPQMTGDDCPWPFNGAFQTTDLASQVSGTSPTAWPVPSGPRQRGHSHAEGAGSAARRAGAAMTSRPKATRAVVSRVIPIDPPEGDLGGRGGERASPASDARSA